MASLQIWHQSRYGNAFQSVPALRADGDFPNEELPKSCRNIKNKKFLVFGLLFEWEANKIKILEIRNVKLQTNC